MASAARPIRSPAAPASRRRAKPVEYNILFTATLCLLAAGAVMVYSASSARTLLEGQGDGTVYLVKYLAFGAVGLVVLQLLARGGLELLPRLTPALLVLSFLMLIAVKIPGVGVEVNGAQRWLGAGPLQFQPSELMKLALVLYAAGLLATTPSRLRNLRGRQRPAAARRGRRDRAHRLPAGPRHRARHRVHARRAAARRRASRSRCWASWPAPASPSCSLFALADPERVSRLTAFINPWADASDTGFQAVQGQIAVGSGGFFGVGLGESVQKVFYLPEAHTDFILAVIGEELGIAGICGLLFLYGLIGYAGLRTAKAAATRYTQLLAAGLTGLIMCQALLNVFAVLGIAPLTGVPLPFISSGSSSLLTLLATMGLLLNIAARSTSHLAALPHPAADRGDARGSRGVESGDRGGRDGRARRAGAGGRRTAEGRGS